MAFHPVGISNTPRCFLAFCEYRHFYSGRSGFLCGKQVEILCPFLVETKSSLHKESQGEVAFLRGMQPN